MAVFHLLLGLLGKALILLCCLLFVAFLGYCLYLRHIHMKYDHIPGPPRNSFFLGHSPTLLTIMNKDGLVHDKFLEWKS